MRDTSPAVARKRTSLTRERVARWLEGSFFLRLHMTLILGGTVLAGFAATVLLRFAGVDFLALRYALAVLGGYFAFLILIRLWLAYVGVARGLDLNADGLDGFSTRGSTTGIEELGGGGQFGGGGATGSWGEAPKTMAMPIEVAPAPRGGGGGGGGSKSGWGLDLDGDGLVVALLLIALVLALLFVGIYFIYTAPALLSEAAFEALLAGALARRARKIDRPGWAGAVWRATVWPFLGILVLSAGLGWAVQRYCPEARQIRDAWHCKEKR
jgi:hypothetical protein